MNNDIITYDVLEIDLYNLSKRLREEAVKEVIVYGIGNNGYSVHKLLHNLGIKIKYFVDVKACNDVDVFKKIEVITPDKLIERYDGELIIITPSIHDNICDWMVKKGISKDKLVVCFYKTESVTIDYGIHYNNAPSNTIKYCKNYPENIKGTFVTIAYNTPEKLLRRAIESVLNQSVKDLKYLFILNGPTDNTAEIIKEYASLDKRIHIIDLGKNLPWTDPVLLSAIRDNIEGDYCCQLDSDDYYDVDFLSESVEIGDKNRADIVCVRTCLFSADSRFDPLKEGLVYDWHDKYFFNVVHPTSHIIGHQNIMKAYARSRICSTFWGKLYSNVLMDKYLNYLLTLSVKERELYYRLDIAMTYRILYMAERVFYSDKVLHFSQYSKKNSTYTLAPIEWLMSLWYAYRGIKEEMYSYYNKKRAKKYAKGFLAIHLLWMVGRKGMLNGSENWKYYNEVIENFNEMISDKHFRKLLVNKGRYMRKDCREFYYTIEKMTQEYR